MCRRLLFSFSLLVFICMVAAVAVYSHFGWTGVLILAGVIVGGALLTPLLVKGLLTRLIMMAFQAKGAVLKSATVEIHHISPAEPPDRAEELEYHRTLMDEIGEGFDDETDDPDDYIAEQLKNDAECNWYQIDVTITPKTTAANKTPFHLWEPGELMLANPNSTMSFQISDGDEDAGPEAEIHKIQIWEEGEFHDDEGLKYPGPQRLLLHAGVPRGSREAQFMYYFNRFGKFELPVIEA